MRLIEATALRHYYSSGVSVPVSLFECPLCCNIVPRPNKAGKRQESCGCRPARRTHGLTGTRLYLRWTAMRNRCGDPANRSYANYGGRGIRVCSTWQRSFTRFRQWAVSHGYRQELQLDRIDNDGDYTPSNCRFVSPQVNARNRRSTKTGMATLRGFAEDLKQGLTNAELRAKYGLDHFQNHNLKRSAKILFGS